MERDLFEPGMSYRERAVRILIGLSALVGGYLIYTRGVFAPPELEELGHSLGGYLWETFCERLGGWVEICLVTGGGLLVFSGVKGLYLNKVFADLYRRGRKILRI